MLFDSRKGVSRDFQNMYTKSWTSTRVFPLTHGILLDSAVQTCKMTMLAVRIHSLCPYGLKHKTSKSTQVLKACIILINYDVSWIKKFVNCFNSDVKN